jgi:DedD protein
MAFFKFRFSDRHASAEAVSSGTNQNMDVVRRRARYRLIGAVVLVLVAVVGFPLVFDTQPRPVSVDTPIVIPDRQSVAPLTSSAEVPAAHAPAKPLKTPHEALSTHAGLDPSEQVVAPAAPVAKPVDKAKDKQADKPKDKSESAHSKTDADLKTKNKSETDKAKSLLEGKSASSERLIIQVGSFSETAKLREVRQKLEKSGFKTYTQVVDKEGKPTTRVRVGPFDSREEAEKVASRIRKLDLSPVVLKL